MMTVTTLNISSNTIKYLVTRGNAVVDWGGIPLAGAIKNGLILEPGTTGDQLKSLFTSGKLPGDRVVCSLNGLPFSYRFFTLPKMEPSTLKEAISRVARREMPMPPEDMYLSWQAYPDGKEAWQFLVSGITRRPVDALIQTLREAGVRPHLLDLPHLLLTRLTSRKDVIIVDFEPDCSNITLVVQGMPLGMHTIPSSGPGATRQDEIRQLTDELIKMVGYYNSNHPAQPIPETTGVLLTGGLSNDPAVAESIRDETGYPVEPLAELPTPVLGIPPELPIPMFAVNIGAALKHAASEKAPARDAPFRHINLNDIIKERNRSQKLGITFKKLWLPLALAVGIGSLITAYQLQNQAEASIRQLQAELQQESQALNQLLASVNHAEQIEDNINEIVASAQEIRQDNQNVLSSRDYVSDINLITQSMPGPVSFSSIDMEAGRIIVEGNASSPFPVVQFVKNLEASGRYSEASIVWIDRPSNAKTDTDISFLITINR